VSNIKRDLMKEIEAKVARKKRIAAQVSEVKTVSKWVNEFFTEYEKIKKTEWYLRSLAVDQLRHKLSKLDKNCQVNFLDLNEPPTIEIYWSEPFVEANNCEKVLVFDVASALFESAMEEM